VARLLRIPAPAGPAAADLAAGPPAGEVTGPQGPRTEADLAVTGAR
jgi:hypothetical protein